MTVIDLAIVSPQPMGKKSWVLVPQVRVDVKSYGMTKHQPAVVLATCRDELLLQLVTVDGAHGTSAPLTIAIPREWWSVKPDGLLSCRMDQTRQGYRFTRTITKLVRLLDRLGREAGRKRATEEQLAARAASRVGRDGECQVCANRQIIQKDVLVLHGYERPGDGAAHGECYGRGYPPYEVSCERLQWFIKVVLEGELRRTREALALLPSLPKLSNQIYEGQEFGRSKYRTEWVKRGAAGFDRLEAAERVKLEVRIKSLTFEISQQSLRVAAWRPAAEPVRCPVAKKPLKIGDRVVRNKAVGGELPGDLAGTILRVTSAPHGTGGTRARIRVLWDNGHEASVEDRQLLLES